MTDRPGSAAEEWKRYWPVVLAGFIGISFAAVPMQTMALFIDPVRSEFGWTRTQFSIGASVFALTVIPFAPIAGAIQDAIGPRLLAIIGVTFSLLAMALLGLTTGSHNLWMGQWSAFALAEMLLKPTIWLAVITSVFVHARGMAIALVLCGTFMAQILVPVLSYFLIAQFGWRLAYVFLGTGWGGTTLILVLLFFRTRERAQGAGSPASAKVETPPAQLSGLSLGEALRNVTLYRIVFALTFFTCVSIAVVTHKVSILQEMAIPRSTAALIAATTGISAIVGQLVTGWLYDRSDSTWIGVTAFGLSTIGFALLLEPVRSPEIIFIAMILFGLSAGAVLQAGMYLTAQYCGQRSFGKIFGLKTSLFSVGLGAGPVLAGAIADHFGTYEPLFFLAIPLTLVCALLVFRLGPYPDWSSREGDARAGDAADPEPPLSTPGHVGAAPNLRPR